MADATNSDGWRRMAMDGDGRRWTATTMVTDRDGDGGWRRRQRQRDGNGRRWTAMEGDNNRTEMAMADGDGDGGTAMDGDGRQ